MSRSVNLGVLGLKAFTGLWALITFSVAAALQSEFFGLSDSVGTIIAAGVLTMLWVIASLVLQFVVPETIVISMMVDTVVYGILFVLALGGTAAESRNANFYRYNDMFSEARLGNATIGLGWILVFLTLLAILVFQVFYTLRNYGGSKHTWFIPFHVLVADGTPRVSGGRNTGIDRTATPVVHDNTAMTQSAPRAELGTHNHQPMSHNNVQTQPPLAPGAGQQV